MLQQKIRPVSGFMAILLLKYCSKTALKPANRGARLLAVCLKISMFLNFDRAVPKYSLWQIFKIKIFGRKLFS